MPSPIVLYPVCLDGNDDSFLPWIVRKTGFPETVLYIRGLGHRVVRPLSMAILAYKPVPAHVLVNVAFIIGIPRLHKFPGVA